MKYIKYKQLLPVLAIGLLFITACSKKSPSYTKYITAEASYVMAIDAQGMLDKLKADGLTMENIISVMSDSLNPGSENEILEMWNKFMDAGLDLKQKVVIAFPTTDIEKGSASVQLLAVVQDAGKLETLIQQEFKGISIEKGSGYSYMEMDGVVAGWTDDAFMLLAPENDQASWYNADIDSVVEAPAARPDTKAKMKEYFALSEKKSMASVKAFTEMLKEKADIAIYTNSGIMSDPTASMALARMPGIKELLEGNYNITYVNFEEGKIALENLTYAGPKMAELLKKYAGPVVDKSMIERYPAALNGWAAFSFKPELITALLQEAKQDALLNLILASEGISLDDVTKAFAGDFAIMFGDIKAVVSADQGKDEFTSSLMPKGNLVATIKIGDTTAFNKIVNIGVKQGMYTKVGNKFVLPEAMSMGMPLVMGIENDLLVIATNPEIYSSYAASPAKTALSANGKTSLEDASVSFFVDIQSILNAIPVEAMGINEEPARNVFNRAKSMFKSGWVNANNFDGKSLKGAGELQLEPGKNSLVQLVRFAMYAGDEMGAWRREQQAIFDNEVKADTSE